jgi:hypothetical protein
LRALILTRIRKARRYSDLTWGNCDDYPESACALLLCLTDKLEALYLHLPAWNAGEYDVLAEFFEDSWEQAQPESDPSYALLPHLSTLSLTADPRASDSLLPDDMPQAFMGGRAIKHLEVFGASLLGNPEFPFLPERWSSLETICLPCAYLSGAWWYRMCKEARPKLKRVELFLAPRYDGEGGDANEPSYYNEAFLLCADTLEHLRIGSPGLVSGLPCLTSMNRLRYLEASVTYIFPTPDAMRAAADICDHLPSSLQSIYLADDLWEPWPTVDPPTTEEEYAGLLKAALFQLLRGSAEKLPRLKAVCLRACPSSWGDYHEETPEMRGLCRVSSRIGSSISMECVTLQGAGRDLGT